MLLEFSKNFSDFELLDTGEGYRLELWGEVVLARPDPQIIWPRSSSGKNWDEAHAIFRSASGEGKGKWEIKHKLPNPWMVKYNLSPALSSSTVVRLRRTMADKKGEGDADVRFLLKLSPFKHTGLFAEQAVNWEWMIGKLKVESYQVIKSENSKTLNLKLDNFKLPNKFRVLNLFGYTGGATMVLAKAGCQVTHVDASKPAITWANENHKLNNLRDDSVRWILDDAVKFVKRELKRGAKYDGIIMDPPAFGHSPTGKTWKFNDDLPGLLADCVQLLSDDAKFLIINGYATNSSALSLNNLLQDSIKDRNGKIEFGELCLKQKSGRMISTGIFARWSV